MAQRSPFDRIEQRKSDGFSQDFWLSDSKSGREEIARREAAAATGGNRRRTVGASRKEFEALTERLAQAFSHERTALRISIREGLASARELVCDWREEVAGLRDQREALPQHRGAQGRIGRVRKAMPPRVVSSKSA